MSKIGNDPKSFNERMSKWGVVHHTLGFYSTIKRNNHGHNMNEFPVHCIKWKKPDWTGDIRTVWFHLYSILEKTKLQWLKGWKGADHGEKNWWVTEVFHIFIVEVVAQMNDLVRTHRPLCYKRWFLLQANYTLLVQNFKKAQKSLFCSWLPCHLKNKNKNKNLWNCC